MKQKWYRLCNRRRWVPVVGTIVLMALLWLPLYLLGDPSIIGFYVIGGLTLLCSLRLGAAYGGKLTNPQIKTMHEQCDPYPLLTECEDQLSYVRNRLDRQTLVINRSAALCAMDRDADGLAALEALNIDDPYCLPMWRYCYYNNAATAALACDQREKAMVYRQKADQTAAAITNLKQQAVVQASTNDWLTEVCLLDGDYQGAAAHLARQAPPTDLYQQVNRAYQIARVEKAQGNLTVARFQLEFVVQKGNRLAVVDKAKTLLEDM